VLNLLDSPLAPPETPFNTSIRKTSRLIQNPHQSISLRNQLSFESMLAS